MILVLQRYDSILYVTAATPIYIKEIHRHCCCYSTRAMLIIIVTVTVIVATEVKY